MRLDRARRAQRVAELVEAAVVGDPLAVQQAAQQHDRLVEPVEPLAEARSPRLEAERIVLPLEPGAADPQDRPTLRDVIEGRRELGGQPRVAEGVRADHQAERRPDGHRRQRTEGRPALEDRALPRPDDRVEVVPGPQAVEPDAVGPLGGVTDRRPRIGLRPEQRSDADVGGHRATTTR